MGLEIPIITKYEEEKMEQEERTRTQTIMMIKCGKESDLSKCPSLVRKRHPRCHLHSEHPATILNPEVRLQTIYTVKGAHKS